MTLKQLQVRKDDLSIVRMVEQALPAIGDGEILVEVERFSLTANNVTYGVVGEKIGYWNFFPVTEDNNDKGWGIIPVWGFAKIIASNLTEMPIGERFYGYFPMASHLIMRPGKISEHRLLDGIDHRQDLPPVYNAYKRIENEADYDHTSDDARMLLHPLYATSFCLHDYFSDNNWFGADQVIITSASSKTAIGVAYALSDDANAPTTVGMTSMGNFEMVQALGLYDIVLTYDNWAEIDDLPTAIIDMSGSGPVLSRLHRHLGDNMRFCSNVGLSHWADNKMESGFIRERSAMFFAPGHIQNRAKQWGPGEFERKAHEFWRSAAKKSDTWLKYKTVSGLADANSVFGELRNGKVSPHTGLIVVLG